MEGIIPLIGVVTVIACVAIFVIMERRAVSARQNIQQWAQANGFTVIEAQRRSLRRGPFFWNSSRYQEVFYVTVRDSAGQTRSLWARSGTFWGKNTDTIDIQWAE